MRIPMKIRRCGREMARASLIASIALLCLSVSSHAKADTILLASTTLVVGSANDTFSFDAPSNGMVTATLMNLGWPDPLSALSFNASTATENVSSWSALSSEVETFQVGAGSYFAHIMATAAGSLNLGLYSLTICFKPVAPVPLPASQWMLLAGVLVLFGLTRAMSMTTSVFRSFDALER